MVFAGLHAIAYVMVFESWGKGLSSLPFMISFISIMVCMALPRLILHARGAAKDGVGSTKKNHAKAAARRRKKKGLGIHLDETSEMSFASGKDIKVITVDEFCASDDEKKRSNHGPLHSDAKVVERGEAIGHQIDIVQEDCRTAGEVDLVPPQSPLTPPPPAPIENNEGLRSWSSESMCDVFENLKIEHPMFVNNDDLSSIMEEEKHDVAEAQTTTLELTSYPQKVALSPTKLIRDLNHPSLDLSLMDQSTTKLKEIEKHILPSKTSSACSTASSTSSSPKSDESKDLLESESWSFWITVCYSVPKGYQMYVCASRDGTWHLSSAIRMNLTRNQAAKNQYQLSCSLPLRYPSFYYRYVLIPSRTIGNQKTRWESCVTRMAEVDFGRSLGHLSNAQVFSDTVLHFQEEQALMEKTNRVTENECLWTWKDAVSQLRTKLPSPKTCLMSFTMIDLNEGFWMEWLKNDQVDICSLANRSNTFCHEARRKPNGSDKKKKTKRKTKKKKQETSKDFVGVDVEEMKDYADEKVLAPFPGYECSELDFAILAQVEYYFSELNLRKDMYLRHRMDIFGSVYISVVANFNRIRCMLEMNRLGRNDKSSSSLQHIVYLLTMSEKLDVCIDRDKYGQICVEKIPLAKVRLRTGWERWVNPSNAVPIQPFQDF